MLFVLVDESGCRWSFYASQHGHAPSKHAQHAHAPKHAQPLLRHGRPHSWPSPRHPSNSILTSSRSQIGIKTAWSWLCHLKKIFDPNKLLILHFRSVFFASENGQLTGGGSCFPGTRAPSASTFTGKHRKWESSNSEAAQALLFLESFVNHFLLCLCESLAT